MLHLICLVNESTVTTDDELAEIAPAIQHQINHDFREPWGTNAEVKAIPTGAQAPDGAWLVVVADDTEVAEALGYHDLTPDFQPVALIGAKLDKEFGANLSVTISHEVLEMLGDPLINQLVEDPDAGRLYAFENCDAVEADELGYEIGGVLVSDFVLPGYFDPNHRGRGERVDFVGQLTEPFAIAKGGYLSYRNVGESEWRQVTADADLSEAEAKQQLGDRGQGERAPGYPQGSRRERRLRASRGGLQVSSARPGDPR